MQIRLTGPKAVVVLLLFLGFVGFRFVTARRALSQDAKDLLALEIQSEYSRDYLKGVTAENITNAKVDSLMALERVTFSKISARGSLDDTIVRVEVLIDGAPPPDGRAVRYFRMHHSMALGWRLSRGTLDPTAFEYYLSIF